MHGAARVDCRDGEKAYVSVNGKECWREKFEASDGAQECGKDEEWWSKDKLVAVECKEEAVDGKLTVRVYTELEQTARDESFAIDNVVIKLISADTGAWSLFARSHLN